MDDLKPKKTVRRRAVAKAGHSPVPAGPIGGSDESSGGAPCGHGGCGVMCNVRYVGPTSHMRDHHIVHVARGVSHIWSAAIITGFAIVLTGAVAFHAVQASTDQRAQEAQVKIKQDLGREIKRVSQQMDVLQGMMKQLQEQCSNVGTPTTAPEDGANAQ